MELGFHISSWPKKDVLAVALVAALEHLAPRLECVVLIAPPFFMRVMAELGSVLGLYTHTLGLSINDMDHPLKSVPKARWQQLLIKVLLQLKVLFVWDDDWQKYNFKPNLYGLAELCKAKQ